MIIKKPYAFFIKMFKPIHLILTFLIAYLVYLDNKLLKFFTNYIYSADSVVGENIRDSLVNNLLYVIPFIVIFVSILILGVMFKKKKPVTLYFGIIFSFIIIIVINLYASNFLKILEGSVVSIKSVKLINDFILIAIGLEIFSLVLFLIRGLGINLKKFDFDSELTKIEISESDKEEIEVSINFDFNESRRKRRKTFRNIKYFYYENKFMINSITLIVLLVLCVMMFFLIRNFNNKNIEGKTYSFNDFELGVNSTIMLNTNYRNEKITDNYLIIVDCKMRSNYNQVSLKINDFSLEIGGIIFKPTTEYNDDLLDLGILYSNQTLENEYNNYLFVFEIPAKYITSDMVFRYSDVGELIRINLRPKNIELKGKKINKKIREEVNFDESLGDIKFKINDYNISDKYLIEYKYCIKENDCINSKEYLKASIDQNFDKNVLKLNVDFYNDSDLNINSFYDFFEKFAIINYSVGGVWYSQNNKFEEIKSNKLIEKNVTYIGVNSNIINADNIELIFSIRGLNYKYVIK